MTPEEKEAFRRKVVDRLKNKTPHECIDEMMKMAQEIDRGEL